MLRGKRKLLVVLGILTIVNAIAYTLIPVEFVFGERRKRGFQAFDRDEFKPKQVVDPFKAIVNPPHVDAAEAKQKLQPNELVLGVELEGLARAYPINMLTGPSREIFNDTLGERHIAATW